MSMLADFVDDLLAAATAAGFPTVGPDTPRELEGVALPALYVRQRRAKRAETSVSLHVPSLDVDVEAVVFTPRYAEGDDGGPVPYGGHRGASDAHDLALEALAAAGAEYVRSVQYPGPVSGREVFTTVVYGHGFPDSLS